ncbi:MAG: antibiotic biosynthesis monooxygenase [Clostridia bacterium]|nr:antibiotic biosynthesis monooxygenase [Clostridia bacterium]
MYTIYVSFTCYPEKREAFVERVRKEGILDAVLAEDGCYRYDYYFSEKDPNELLLIEAWESKDHQQVHIAQPHMAQLRTFNSDYIQSAKLGEFELK